MKRASAIRLGHEPSKGGSIGRNFVRTPTEAEAFRREISRHKRKVTAKLLPSMAKEVDKLVVEKVTSMLEKMRHGAKASDLNTYWIETVDDYIIRRMPIEGLTKKRALTNKSHEARLTEAMTNALIGEPVNKQKAEGLISHALMTLEGFKGKRTKQMRDWKGMLEEEADIVKMSRQEVMLGKELVYAMKEINTIEFKSLMGPEYSALYSELYLSGRVAFERILRQYTGQ